MATTPRTTETPPPDDSPTAAVAADSPAQNSPTDTAMSSRGRWILASIAGVGVLSVGLLGGILIGQQMSPSGPHTPPVVLMNHGGPGHVQQLPGELRERIKERMADQRQQRRDQRNNSGQAPPSPSAPSPDDNEPSDNG